jgi:hypothetical protein
MWWAEGGGVVAPAGTNVLVNAVNVSLASGTAIHADALGHSGGSPGMRNAAGFGAGGFGDLGGAGGSHGGVGVTGEDHGRQIGGPLAAAAVGGSLVMP